jgi:hypothetical protein
MVGERRPRAGRLVFLSVLVLAVAWPALVPSVQAQQQEQGPSYVERVTRMMLRDRESPRYPPRAGSRA